MTGKQYIGQRVERIKDLFPDDPPKMAEARPGLAWLALMVIQDVTLARDTAAAKDKAARAILAAYCTGYADGMDLVR